MTPRTRSTVTPGTTVGHDRYNLYKCAYARINEAMRQGFYLEAITIIESLVSDRLESRLTFVMGKDFSFKTLGKLISQTKNVEANDDLRELVCQDLDEWRKDRNVALHEMAKIADGDSSTWADRVEKLILVAKNGLTLLRKIDRQCKALRKAELKANRKGL